MIRNLTETSVILVLVAGLSTCAAAGVCDDLYWEPQLLSTNGDNEGVGLGDLDGDGDPDAVVTTWIGEQNVLYLNDGSGTFSRTNLPGTPTRTGIAFGDLDLDGGLDAFAAGGHD